MASKFYGARGNLVEKYQKRLNGFGANLKEDGVWGDKTEKAYNQYMDQFGAADSALTGKTSADGYTGVAQSKASAPNMDDAYMSTGARSEKELRRLAENQYGSMYNQEIEDAERRARDQQQARHAQIEALTPLYEQQLASLKQEYAGARQNLSDEALSRGLGRSSYVTDQLANNQQGELAASGQLQSDKTKRMQALEAEIAQLSSDLSATTSRLGSERERAILAAMDKYAQEDRTAASEAAKYNNSLWLERERLRLQREKFEYDKKKKKR